MSDPKKNSKKNPKSQSRVKKRRGRDHPEQYLTEKESLFDMHEDQLNVDPLPMEDIKIELRDEKQKDKTKNSSSSEKKYKSD